MADHVKLFGIIVNLIIGTWAAVYAYQMYKSYAYSFLQPIVYHIILFNLSILGLFIFKYSDVNLPENFLPDHIPVYEDIGYPFFYLLIIGMTYAMLRIVLGFQRKNISPRVKLWIIAGTIIFVLGCSVMMILPHQSAYYKWFYNIYENIGVIFFIFEIALLINLLIYGKRCQDRGKKKISNAFVYFYLSRYAFIGIAFVLPGLIRAFTTFLFFNIIPFLWLKYFFLEYAESMLSYIEDNAVLEPIFEKYNISKREQEIVKLILDGKSNKEIEDILFISYHTVKNHVYNLYQKLGVKNRYQLVHFFTKFEKGTK